MVGRSRNWRYLAICRASFRHQDGTEHDYDYEHEYEHDYEDEYDLPYTHIGGQIASPAGHGLSEGQETRSGRAEKGSQNSGRLRQRGKRDAVTPVTAFGFVCNCATA